MGGNALKDTAVRRINKADFQRISETVVAGLRATYPDSNVTVIKSFRNKADFGDIDIVLTREGLPSPETYESLAQTACERFNATSTFHQKNATYLSFNYRDTPEQVEAGVQVDLITCRAEDFDFTCQYMAYNDLGNLMGRIAHKQGLCFGDVGLLYYYRVGTYLFRTIVVTKDFDAATRYLGFSPERHRKGFDDPEDIFEYVASSPYFNPDIFLLENRNYKSRIRDRKRKTYTSFLKWCADRPDLPRYPFPEDKSEWIPRLCEAFPLMRQELAQAARDLEVRQTFNARFNGERVSALTGLTDKALSGFMKQFRATWTDPQELERFVLTCEAEELAERIRQFFTEYTLLSQRTPE